ncbi:TPA: hypothetical protein JLT83_004513 [Escherichia coli]|nr:hypothetical protein [Escherichia coli]
MLCLLLPCNISAGRCG